MKNTMLNNVPLKSYIPVDEVFCPFPIYFLRIASLNPYSKSITRILNSLHENAFITIDDILNSTLMDLRKARNFGEKGISVLLELLLRLSDQPELVLDTKKLDDELSAELERIKQAIPIKIQFHDIGIDI